MNWPRLDVGALTEKLLRRCESLEQTIGSLAAADIDTTAARGAANAAVARFDRAVPCLVITSRAFAGGPGGEVGEADSTKQQIGWAGCDSNTPRCLGLASDRGTLFQSNLIKLL